MSDDEDPWYVREVDDHTGVADGQGMPYTYEHVEEYPEPSAEVYRVTCVLELVDRPLHKNVHFVEAHRLEEFFSNWGKFFEEVVDIRPITYREAEREFREFEGTGGDSE